MADSSRHSSAASSAKSGGDASGGDGRRASKRNSMRSSMFNRRRLSFYRSEGKRGADVETLRGTTGADFEGTAKVKRAGGTGGLLLCGCCFQGSANKLPKTEHFVLIKGANCFIYDKEEDKAPRYAIALAHMKTDVEEVHHGHTTVLLETNLGDVDFEFNFDTSKDADIAKKFQRVIKEQSAIAEAEIARKRLGHEQLLQKRASVKYADSVAQKKVDDQPEAPVSAGEVIDAMPVKLDNYAM